MKSSASLKNNIITALLPLLALLVFSTTLAAGVVPVDFGSRGAPAGVKLGPNREIENITPKDKMQLPTARLSVEIGEAFSLELWMRVESEALLNQTGADEKAPMTVLNLHSPDKPELSKQHLLIRLSEGRVVVASTTDLQKWRVLNSSVRIGANQWYHIAVTRSGRQTNLYINGFLAASLDTLPQLTGITNIVFGRTGGRRHFVGTLLHPRIHDRALDEDEVKALAGARPAQIGGARLNETGGARTQETGGGQPGETQADSGPVSFGRYPVLRVVDGDLHPLIEQLAVTATVVHWRGPQARDLLITGVQPIYIGWRLALYQQKGVDHRGLPFYDEGTTIRGLPGTNFRSVMRPDGKEELFAKGLATSYGSNNLIAYTKDSARGVDFNAVRKVKIEPAVDRGITSWWVGDLDGDGIPDLLVGLPKSGGTGYWPDNEGMWDEVERKNSGKGRGYDLQGQWLGFRHTQILYWAKGRINPRGELEFVDRKPVYYRQAGFEAQWRGWGPFAMAGVKIAGRTVIVHTGNNDRVLALPCVFRGGELIIEESKPLLEEDTPLRDTFWPYSISVLEEKNDGTLRLLLDGNNSRLTVLEGRHIGQFREVGPLMAQGGPVAVDTLATPARFDWDGDGFPDLIIGDASGWLTFWRGTKDPTVYHAGVFMTSGGKVIHHQAGLTGSIQGSQEERFGYTEPTVGDWDGNGKAVIITSDITTKLTLYRPTDKSSDLAEPVVFTKDGKPYEVAWRSRPAIIPAKMNFAGSGLPALLHTDWDGHLAVAIPDKLGSTNIARVVKLTHTDGKPIALCGVSGNWGRIETNVADWNGDGKWDILFGTVPKNNKVFSNDNFPRVSPWLLENVGANEKPVFAKARPIKLKDGTPIQLGMHNASVFATDLDGDGTLDLIVGAEDGKIYRFPRSELE